MPITVPDADKSATNPPADTCVRSRRMLRSNLRIVETASDLFPVKTALQLSDITGAPLRTVESWLTGNVKIPSDALIALLQSDCGREFLAAVMADAEPRWWVRLKAFFRALDVMAMQRITRRKLKEALDADQAFAPPFAAMLQDEDFFGSQPSPARRPVQSMASRKAK